MTLQVFKRFPGQRVPRFAVLVPSRLRSAYPALAADLAVIDREVRPAFEHCDRAALRSQHLYRRQQVLILLGSAMVVGLGGLQAALPDHRWPGVALAMLGTALGLMSRSARDRDRLDEYLSERVKAERLRSQCFRYLSRTGRYASADRDVALRRAVVAVLHGREPR
jgi:hypothetical protein